MSSSTDSSAVPRLDDNQRIQRLLDEVNNRFDRKAPRPVRNELDNASKLLLLEYTSELTKNLIVTAAELALHRGSDVVEDKDIILVLAKKLGVFMAGEDQVSVHHHSDLKSSLDSAERAYKTGARAPGSSLSSDLDRITGMKRKSNEDDDSSRVL